MSYILALSLSDGRSFKAESMHALKVALSENGIVGQAVVLLQCVFSAVNSNDDVDGARCMYGEDSVTGVGIEALMWVNEDGSMSCQGSGLLTDMGLSAYLHDMPVTSALYLAKFI